MAARRILCALSLHRSHAPPTAIRKDPLWHFLPRLLSTTNNNNSGRGGTPQPTNEGKEESSAAAAASVKYSASSSIKASPRHDMAMVFTCKVCETRSVKTLCKESYEKGVVVARCGGCNNLHLIADRLGWFGEPGSVEELLAARGEEIRKASSDSSFSFTPQDLAGIKSIIA